jgi:UDP-glucuronate 4-epimerase
MAAAFHHIHGLPMALLRFFTVYGPRGRPDMAFARFTEALRLGGALRLHGETTERDFTYIDDIVDGVLGAADWVAQTRGFDTFNLGRSEPVRVRRLIELLSEALAERAQIELGSLQPGESLRTAADVEKARLSFGYAPKISLEEGVRRWVAWVDGSPEAPPHLRRR